MVSKLSFRNRNFYSMFVVFQLVFVTVQVMIFYPCLHGAPQSTVFHSDSHRVNERHTKTHRPGLLKTNTHTTMGVEPKTTVNQLATIEIDTHLKNQILGNHNINDVNTKSPQNVYNHTKNRNITKESEILKGQFKKMKLLQATTAKQQAQLKAGIKYDTSWGSLDSRPIPTWYDDAKIGIFLHWGVYSVPSFAVANGLAEWFWFYWKNEEFEKPVDEFQRERLDASIDRHSDAIGGVKAYASRTYGPNKKYTDFATEFKAEMFNAKKWATIFKSSGAKYVVLTSKHHDGYTMWPSKHSWNWNSVDIGPHRDLVGELGKAVKEAGLHYGLYHSLYEWFNPKYVFDKRNDFQTQTFIKEKMMPELKELVTTYKPDIVWSDGQFEAPCSYWNCTQFLTWLYNESPVKDNVVTNDRWGTDVLCKHGGFLTCADRYNPEEGQTRKWENCMTIDRESWGYRRNAELEDYYTIEGLIALLAETVSKGGNLLMNVGPTSDGRIPPIFEERLTQLGTWMQVNQEAIYRTTGWIKAKDPINELVYYTEKASKEGPVIYAIVTSWPSGSRLELAAPYPSSQTRVTWLGYNGLPLEWETADSNQPGIVLKLPKVSLTEIPCQWAWVFKFTHLLNSY